jgi:aspartokinase/homoserine dehydrogenase 1
MNVLKFGGSSVANPERIRLVEQIVREAERRSRVIVVVSAFQGTTDQLLACARTAERGDLGYRNLFQTLSRNHLRVLRELLPGRKGLTTKSAILELLKELKETLNGIELLHDCPPRTLDLVASFGERFSSVIVAAYLSQKGPAFPVDARNLIITDDHFTNAGILFGPTNKAICDYFRQHQKGTAVVSGFLGATEDGWTTTIGRNGSDYTATILGAALGASMVEIWTDVDGIMSADPRSVPAAFVLPQVTYEEAMELSYFGAEVLHSAALAPAVAANIPILIKNTLNPAARGTLISKKPEYWEGTAKGVSSIDGIALVTLRGLAMVGVPGTAERLFRTLAKRHVNVILISQASSEHTICFAIRSIDTTAARKAIQEEFHYEMEAGVVTIDEKTPQTIIAVVGEGMKGTPGVAGKVFQALGQNAVNISAIAQGASERNISFVIDSANKIRALNIIHSAFFEKRKKLHLIIVGVGNIGATLLQQLLQQHQYLFSRGFEVRVCGLANSERMVFNANGIEIGHWQEELKHADKKMDARQMAEEVRKLDLTNVALVDCTASEELSQAYALFVDANMHIVTPNKRANVLPLKQYKLLMEKLIERQKFFLYEANVGAGLPVISTLHDLIASGDRIKKIEGILSGTLSYLFNSYDGSRPFSEIVREAHKLGFTEPDPRDDLRGEDVARKLLILARQTGWEIDLKDIHVENLVPSTLRHLNTKQFLKKLPLVDTTFQKRYERANSHGSVLRYVAKLAYHRGSAGLVEVPMHHPFALTKGSDNIFAFTTDRYSRTPLIVQGPGAGAEVTAGAVFSDILKLLHYLPF